ncbi:MAG: helix-turn-helix domain-containing protein [Phycisphaerae bacterium]|nr:helix-turn-helix domain-containing protein [Phycisphaerae bacterium]
MIHNETEYQQAVANLAQSREYFAQQRERLKKEGFPDEAITTLIDSAMHFHLNLQWEVEHYERIMRGEFPELENLHGLGFLLISLRIAQGISQRELAKRLDVHESQVSRDERNEYFGITVERAAKILDAMNVRLKVVMEKTTPVVPAKRISSRVPSASAHRRTRRQNGRAAAG